MSDETSDVAQAVETSAAGTSPKITIETLLRSDAPRAYFDGVAGVHIGPSVAKLDFFQATVTRHENGDIHEHRDVTYSAIIPTIQFFELVANSIEGALDNRQLITQSLAEVLDRVGVTAKRAAAKV